MPDTRDRPLLGGGAAAELLGVSRSKLYALVRAGVLDSALVRLDGHELMFRRGALLRWLDGDADARPPLGAA